MFTLFQSTNKRGIWIFGFGSLVHTPGFEHGEVLDGYIKGYRRVWWQNSTDHRGTPDAPGRVVTLQRTSDDIVTVRARHSAVGAVNYVANDDHLNTVGSRVSTHRQ